MRTSFALAAVVVAAGGGFFAAHHLKPATASAAALVSVDPHAGHDMAGMEGALQQGTAAQGAATQGATPQGTAPQGVTPDDPRIAPGAAVAAGRLQRSPRHQEWVKIALEPGSRDSVMAWVVYPQSKKNAPVVVVVHEIFGLSTWVRGVADQLAADGFIAIAPDLLSIERGGATADSLEYDKARAMIRAVTPDKMNKMVAAMGQYGMSLPSAKKVYGVVGYCWGGSAVFNHAVFNAAGMKAGVAYYGSAPAPASLATVTAPVLGLYGENDQRVNATIAPTDSTMKALKKTYEYKVFAGAGHGFLRAQDQPANAAAAREAWPMTVAWFKKHLGA